ncbi:MAG: hypothetical protein ACFFC7_20285 [Candidatus Hermodarchaeota archaeon]
MRKSLVNLWLNPQFGFLKQPELRYGNHWHIAQVTWEYDKERSTFRLKVELPA